MFWSGNMNGFFPWTKKTVQYTMRSICLLFLLVVAAVLLTVMYVDSNDLSIDSANHHANYYRKKYRRRTDAAVAVKKIAYLGNNNDLRNNNMPIDNLYALKERLQDEVDEMLLPIKRNRSNEIHYDGIGIEYGTFVNFTTDTNHATETVEVMFFDDLKYRRACTSVGRYSTLCMVVRYPFHVPLQVNDPMIRYPKPVDDRFYDLDINNVYVITRDDWLLTCSNQEKNKTDMIIHDDDKNDKIKICMEKYAKRIAESRQDHKEPVISMWTRRTTKNNIDGVTLFHGTDYDEALDRVYQFFGHDHEVMVVGASPAPNVTEGIKSIFGSKNCQKTNIMPAGEWYPNYNCDHQPNISRRLLSKTQQSLAATHDSNLRNNLKGMNRNVQEKHKLDFTDLEENHINLGKADYRLTGDADDNRLLTGKTVLEALFLLHRKPGFVSLRNLSLIVEYPFAHVQRQEMLLDENLYQRVQLHQNVLPEYFYDFLNVSSSSQSVLSSRGYHFQHMFAFDGIPQFWPTATSGFAGPTIYGNTDSNIINGNIADDKILLQDFFKTNITGWNPDYGTSCRGPLPPNSMLRDVNLLSRRKFETLGFDMAWYGRTWEFTNLFWFQVKKWSHGHQPGKKAGLGLDCTHPQGVQGFNKIHGFFVQAMIDDYFD